VSADFEPLYREYYPRVYGLCRKLLGGSGEAQDAAQEVFMRAHKAIASYDTSQPFAPWVFSIASNYCVDLIRRRSRERAVFADAETEVEALEADAPALPELIADRERDDALRKAVAALPEKYRVPLVLAYFNGSSYDEIAATLDITRTHVGVLLLRAKKELRRALAGSTMEVPA